MTDGYEGAESAMRALSQARSRKEYLSAVNMFGISLDDRIDLDNRVARADVDIAAAEIRYREEVRKAAIAKATAP